MSATEERKYQACCVQKNKLGSDRIADIKFEEDLRQHTRSGPYATKQEQSTGLWSWAY